MKVRNGLALAFAATALLALVAVGCGGGSDNGGSANASGGGGGSAYGGGNYGGGAKTATPASTGGAAVVSVANNPKLGSILVDSKGNTLYYFLKDKGGQSSCNGACAAAWPPYTTSGSPKAEKGAKSSMLGTTKRTDGSTQVTYNNFPLYTYTGDSKPGDTKGNDITQFGGEWYALTPAGTKPKD
jgi:predicted lipoprotein with Yx(FWY)xxD motif